jgi:hypothetical protein
LKIDTRLVLCVALLSTIHITTISARTADDDRAPSVRSGDPSRRPAGRFR